MKIKIIQVPYDSGYFEKRTGLGPACFLQKGLDRRLREKGHTVQAAEIRSKTDFNTEVATAFELNRILAEQVKTAVSLGAFPLILAGNCNTCLGALAGLGTKNLGLVWFDAHGEFNTPDTTTSGWLDGMPLALATGRCYRALLKTVDGFTPAADENILLVGARDLDPEEEIRLDQSRINLVKSEGAVKADIPRRVRAALDGMKTRVEGVYLHIDLDAVDYGRHRANHLDSPGGLDRDLFLEIIGLVKSRFELRALNLASYDPECDGEGKALETALGLVERILS